jgi:hypothetical protein
MQYQNHQHTEPRTICPLCNILYCDLRLDAVGVFSLHSNTRKGIWRASFAAATTNSNRAQASLARKLCCIPAFAEVLAFMTQCWTELSCGLMSILH